MKIEEIEKSRILFGDSYLKRYRDSKLLPLIEDLCNQWPRQGTFTMRWVSLSNQTLSPWTRLLCAFTDAIPILYRRPFRRCWEPSKRTCGGVTLVTHSSRTSVLDRFLEVRIVYFCIERSCKIRATPHDWPMRVASHCMIFFSFNFPRIITLWTNFLSKETSTSRNENEMSANFHVFPCLW